MFSCSLIRAWILVHFPLDLLRITKQNVAGRLQTGTCWMLLVSPAHYKHVWTMWKVKAAARVWSVCCSLWGETLPKCSFHNITFNFYWEATFQGFESHPAETFSTHRFSALTRTSTTPIHFHLTPRQRAVISLSPLGSQSPVAAPTVLPVCQTSRCSVSTLDQKPWDRFWYI